MSNCIDCPGNTYSVRGAAACEACLRGFFYTLEETCRACPEGTSCLVDGGSTQEQLTIEPKNWRISGKTDVIHECPYPEACLGGSEFTDEGNGYCAVGYKGPLCSVCEEDYYLNQAIPSCIKCGAGESTLSWQIITLLCILVWD